MLQLRFSSRRSSLFKDDARRNLWRNRQGVQVSGHTRKEHDHRWIQPPYGVVVGIIVAALVGGSSGDLFVLILLPPRFFFSRFPCQSIQGRL
jgi:hypothetical protein